MTRRIGVLGCGQLGQFLVRNILSEESLELVFVWDIDQERLKHLSIEYPDVCIIGKVEDAETRKPDLVIEVAHPDVTRKYAVNILKFSDYLIGSPSALADSKLYTDLLTAANPHSLYIPSGAFWGGEDIRKMADLGTLERLRVSMTFHPCSLKLMDGEVKKKNDGVVGSKTTLYDGTVRNLCKQAPNNVNTMAAAAIAGHNLGFDGVEGHLISDPNEKNRHIVEIEVWAKTDPQTGLKFHVHTIRSNPSVVGQVTGSATLPAFFGSILRAKGKGAGIHLC